MRLFGILSGLFFLISNSACQTINPDGTLQAVASNSTLDYDLQIAALKLIGKTSAGKNQAVFSLALNFTDSTPSTKACTFSVTFFSTTTFPFEYPCQDEQGLNVSSVALRINQFPSNSKDLTNATFDLDVWHE